MPSQGYRAPALTITQLDESLLFENSKKMKALGEIVKRISDTDVPVLITGESGTGKELVAHAIHARSLRNNKDFVKVNCATIPKELLESELFGYEKGAFTGADSNKPGRFEFAHGGTIFLDELGDMPLFLQSKLLRVLQDGQFFRLGGKTEINVDARVITSTNRDLERMVAKGEFREDLFYRLNVIRVHIPPLRERKEEIFPLARHFLQKYGRLYGRPGKNLSEKTFSLLTDYTWPGNVRELENMIRKMVVLENEETVLREFISIRREEIDPGLSEQGDHPRYSLRNIGKKAALEAEKKAIRKVLEQTRWNRSKAAKILRVSYKTLLYKIKESGLDN
jgi:transcriptional regulator with PAS, ATPase and Fis domain